MQPSVIMNGDEFRTALLTLGVRQFSNVIKVPEDYEPSETVVQEMLLKKFFVIDDEGNPDWNGFVHMVLWTAVNAESELRIDGRYGSSCRLFFQGDTMILLSFEAGKDEYTLFFISVIPQAMGGLASVLDWLEAPMNKLSTSMKDGALAEEDADPATYASSEVLLEIRGWVFGKPDYRARLAYSKGVHTFAWSCADGGTGNDSVTFFQMIQHLIPWVVKAHGESIKAKGEIDVAL